MNNGATVIPGVYEKDGEIFVVKPNREGTRVYAKKLVDVPGGRVAEGGKRVDFDFEYAKGAIYKLSSEDQMPVERAKALIGWYGRCINCGRTLTAAVSVERGIGPVCIKAFKAAAQAKSGGTGEAS